MTAFLLLGPVAKAQGEVFLTAANSVGQDPFTAPVAQPSSTIKAQPPNAGTGGTPSYYGSTPGLYGGMQNVAVCDKQKMIDYLRANPDKLRAWAEAEGIDTNLVPAYIAHLTSVLLRYDTRVTNHGFVNAYANPYQDVLQAGTAVLVDVYGTPRARCYCGNPLTPPYSLHGTPTYNGTPWAGYQPATIIIVQPAPQPQQTITVVDPQTNQPFPLPLGGTSPPRAPSASPSPGATPSPSPSTAVPPGDHYALTFSDTNPFGQYVDDSGNTSTVTKDLCQKALAAIGETSDTVVQITGTSITMTFQGGALKGKFDPADSSYDALSDVMPTAAGTTQNEAKGTVTSTVITGAIRETINVSQGGGPTVTGGCDYLFRGFKT
ncbi:MAG: DUF6777 domain-containing protein [Candidatus Dormibacteria bacterium]